MGLTEDVQANEPPWTCTAHSPLDGTTISRARQAHKKPQEAYFTQRSVDPPGLEELRKVTWSLLLMSWCWAPTSTLLPESRPHLWRRCSLSRAVFQMLRFLHGDKGKGKKE